MAWNLFSFVERESIRKYLKVESVSVDTFMKYLHKLTLLVERKFSSMLPEQFALVYDGWSLHGTHYLCIFATYPSTNKYGFQRLFLAFSPFEDETKLTAEEHENFVHYILENYGKGWDNVVCLMADNCSTNQAFANRVQKRMVGCHSHRFNIALQDLLKPYTGVVDKINNLMQKLKFSIPAAKLRKYTPLVAKTKNSTRWSSTYEMIDRYRKIMPFLKKLDIENFDALLLLKKENEEVDELFIKLCDLQSVTKILQCDNTTLSEARVLFDAVIEDHPTISSRLGSDASIVHSPVFESAIRKLQHSVHGTLTEDEKESVDMLRISNENEIQVSVRTKMNYAERAIKKMCTTTCNDKFMDTRFILATSNICERFFSKAGYAVNERRLSIKPSNLEEQMFLHVNKEVWGLMEVQAIINEKEKGGCSQKETGDTSTKNNE